LSASTDPITTEVIRHGLNSAAEQMKRALVRTAFSPVIYEVLDFAVAIYDHRIRLLAQAPSLPLFMGTLGFCVEEAVKEVGGQDALDPGDILLYNIPYGSGTHQQDAALVLPVFLADELIGYTSIKGHRRLRCGRQEIRGSSRRSSSPPIRAGLGGTAVGSASTCSSACSRTRM
jgi:N-methylhydantoinase B